MKRNQNTTILNDWPILCCFSEMTSSGKMGMYTALLEGNKLQQSMWKVNDKQI